MTGKGEWTPETLLAHLKSLLDERDRLYQEQIRNAGGDIDALRREWREAHQRLIDASNADIKALEQALDDLRASRDEAIGRNNWKQYAITVVISVTAAMASVVYVIVQVVHK